MITTLLIVAGFFLAMYIIKAIGNAQKDPEVSTYMGIPIYDFDEWYDLHEDEIYRELQKSPIIFEKDFNFEEEIHKRYEQYLDETSAKIKEKYNNILTKEDEEYIDQIIEDNK